MTIHNCIRSNYDSCVYSIKGVGNSITCLSLYIDDMLIAIKDNAKVKNVKTQLYKEFEIKDLGTVRKILSMEILRDMKAGILYLSKKKYIENVFHRFSILNAKAINTHLTVHFKLSSDLCPQ